MDWWVYTILCRGFFKGEIICFECMESVQVMLLSPQWVFVIVSNLYTIA